MGRLLCDSQPAFGFAQCLVRITHLPQGITVVPQGIQRGVKAVHERKMAVLRVIERGGLLQVCVREYQFPESVGGQSQDCMTHRHGGGIIRALSHAEKIFCQPLRGSMLPAVQVEGCQAVQSRE